MITQIRTIILQQDQIVQKVQLNLFQKNELMVSNFSDKKWYLITIDIPDMINGDGIFTFINLFLKIFEFRYIIICDIYGAPKPNHLGLITYFQYQELKIIPLKKFLEDVQGVKLFDWGDFFLFKNYPKNWVNHDSYPDVIKQTDTTIRAVDDQYIYIYTPHQEIISLMQDNFTIESLKFDILENLDYPY